MKHKILNGHTGEWDDLAESLKHPAPTSRIRMLIRAEQHVAGFHELW